MAFPEARTGRSPQNQGDSALPWLISCQEGSAAVQEQGEQHVGLWDNGRSQLHLGDSTGARLCSGLGEELVLLGTTSLQELFLECRSSQILLDITGAAALTPLYLQIRNTSIPFITKQHLITADQMTWLVYILKKTESSFDLSQLNTAHLFYFHGLDCPFLIIQLE